MLAPVRWESIEDSTEGPQSQEGDHLAREDTHERATEVGILARIRICHTRQYIEGCRRIDCYAIGGPRDEPVYLPGSEGRTTRGAPMTKSA